MEATLTLTPEYGKFDIRACPIWAIPQLAELCRRLSHDGERKVMIVSFIVVHSFDEFQSGRFVIDIHDEDIYYGYLSARNMNEYQHPALLIMY